MATRLRPSPPAFDAAARPCSHRRPPAPPTSPITAARRPPRYRSRHHLGCRPLYGQAHRPPTPPPAIPLLALFVAIGRYLMLAWSSRPGTQPANPPWHLELISPIRRLGQHGFDGPHQYRDELLAARHRQSRRVASRALHPPRFEGHVVTTGRDRRPRAMYGAPGWVMHLHHRLCGAPPHPSMAPAEASAHGRARRSRAQLWVICRLQRRRRRRRSGSTCAVQHAFFAHRNLAAAGHRSAGNLAVQLSAQNEHPHVLDFCYWPGNGQPDRLGDLFAA